MRAKRVFFKILIIILLLTVSIDMLALANTFIAWENSYDLDESFIENLHGDNTDDVICPGQNFNNSSSFKNIDFSEIAFTDNLPERFSIKANINVNFQIQKNHLQIARLKAG